MGRPKNTPEQAARARERRATDARCRRALIPPAQRADYTNKNAIVLSPEALSLTEFVANGRSIVAFATSLLDSRRMAS